ncbi:septum formation initiator family protein [Georgenia sp. MJ173]|uniref:FtsB family cell division protein n=1 Tax=Georgenia sunbinii TaxID=3117728 RepID=UPI002F26B3A2
MSARRPTGPRGAPGANRPAGATTRPAGGTSRAGGAARAGRSPAARTTPGGSTRRPPTARPAATRPAAAPPTSGRGPVVDTADETAAPTITLRGLGLFIVLLVAFVVLAPTLRHAVEQQEQMRQLSANIETELTRNEALELELEQWQDETFVQAQARDRLGYVMPGEQTYRVIDPEVVVGEEAEEEVGAIAAMLDAPWYVTIWDSVTMAGEAGSGDDATGDGRSTRSAG